MATATIAAPDRSLAQRMAALERANVVRTYRSRVKRDLKAGRRRLVDVLLAEDPKLETMKVFELMTAAPKLGRVKVNRALVSCRISPSKTVGGLSTRQMRELVDYLRQR